MQRCHQVPVSVMLVPTPGTGRAGGRDAPPEVREDPPESSDAVPKPEMVITKGTNPSTSPGSSP